ncbi:MAG TPA: polysaccharide biosynthesis tyrosine autokinase [Intrasporangium sp.]|uniref:polysaccharide biosynthesis tyrosine autokinase n=1 Tax=Intrasporangium sp. TaxID=1925024 RepID=UPI002F95F6A5
MTIRDLLGVIRTRWRLIAFCMLVVIGATAATSIATTPVYEATARIYLATVKASDNEPGGAYAITQKDLNTYAEILDSPDIQEPLRERLGLAAGTPLNVSATVAELTNMLDIKAHSSNPQLAAAVANEAGPVLAEAAKKFSPLLANNNQIVTADAIIPASVPSEPISPNVKTNLALALLAGLIVGVGVALIRHMSDTKVRGEDDIRELSDRPILGTIPLVKNANGTVLSVADDPHSHHAESIRRLRTNILFVDVTTQGHSFVITSSNPGEGKTTTSVNLAIAMADAGSKVLLIDGDLRNPTVAKTMGIEGGSGLTTVLLRRAEPLDVVQRWRDTNLYVLPAGQIPPNPSELLGSEAMSLLFQKLSQDFDYILVDSPPINPVIDAVLLNQLTHGLLMVVAAERTRRRELEAALRSLNTVDVPVSGFALNLATTANSLAYRYGTYGYGQTAAVHSSRTERASRRKATRRPSRTR